MGFLGDFFRNIFGILCAKRIKQQPPTAYIPCSGTSAESNQLMFLIKPTQEAVDLPLLRLVLSPLVQAQELKCALEKPLYLARVDTFVSEPYYVKITNKK